jgi:hypothetical protein
MKLASYSWQYVEQPQILMRCSGIAVKFGMLSNPHSHTLINVIITTIMHKAMFGIFCPLEEYVGPSILTVGALCFVVLVGHVYTFSLEFIYLPFVERGISNVIWIFKFYFLD